MIRFVDIKGEPIWLNPERIDAIGLCTAINAETGNESSKIVWHSGTSCMCLFMKETVDEVKKMIEEAEEKLKEDSFWTYV